MKQRKMNLWTPAKLHKKLQLQLKKLTVRYNRRQSIETQNRDKEINRRKLKKRRWKINNRNEWQRKKSCGYINSNWIFNWLILFPITEFGFELSKQQFWDSIRFRYGWEISNLPTSCPCGSKFDIQHSMSCKKGSFIYTT